MRFLHLIASGYIIFASACLAWAMLLVLSDALATRTGRRP